MYKRIASDVIQVNRPTPAAGPGLACKKDFAGAFTISPFRSECRAIVHASLASPVATAGRCLERHMDVAEIVPLEDREYQALGQALLGEIGGQGELNGTGVNSVSVLLLPPPFNSPFNSPRSLGDRYPPGRIRLAQARTTTLVKTKTLEIIRLVIPSKTSLAKLRGNHGPVPRRASRLCDRRYEARFGGREVALPVESEAQFTPRTEDSSVLVTTLLR